MTNGVYLTKHMKLNEKSKSKYAYFFKFFQALRATN